MPRSPEPWKARVVSSVSADSDSAFQIAFGDAKYLFNCPENTTRAMLSRKLGFNKYKAVFLSRISSNTSTGLPGFLMTLADSGTPNLTVHGPPGLMHFLASARSYLLRFSPPTLPGIHGNSDPIFSDRLELNAFETTVSTSEPIYTDNNVSVYAIPVSAPDSDKPSTTEDAIPEPDSPYSLKRKHPDIHEDAPVAKRTSFDGAGRKGSPQRDTRSDMKKQDPDGWRKLIVRRMFPGKDGVTFHGGGDQSTLRQRLPQWSHRPFATSYLVVGPEFRGKFDGALADRLGVPHGPARRKLTTGENVTLENGQVITPDMVIGKTSLSASVLIVDCPDPKFVDGLVNSTHLTDMVSSRRQQLHCVFHMASPNVMKDPRYRRWMATLGDGVHHIISNSEVCTDETTFPAAEALQRRLSLLDATMFWVPWSRQESENGVLNEINAGAQVLASKRQAIGMRPLLAPEDEIILGQFEGTELLDSSDDHAFRGVKEKIAAEVPVQILQPGDDVIITCLGTGSAMPGKYRNVSGLLVQIPGSGNVILDCGEGTWGQLQRNFGLAAPKVLRDVKCIYLSHIHGDHHMGITRLLAQRLKLSPPPNEPLYLICTGPTWGYLQEYNELEELGLGTSSGVHPIICSAIEHRQSLEQSPQTTIAVKGLCAALNLKSVQTAEVIHRTKAYGVVLKHSGGWSLTYSGDTKPCQNLVNAGKGSTILIHEATMADDQVAMADEKAHSTIGQAVDIAKRMQVQKLLLTHFSTRYPKIPILGTHGSDLASRTDATVMPVAFVAFDFLNIRLGDFARAEKYLPNLEAAFSELKDDDIVATLQRE